MKSKLAVNRITPTEYNSISGKIKVVKANDHSKSQKVLTIPNVTGDKQVGLSNFQTKMGWQLK